MLIDNSIILALAISLLYPLFYDGTQAWKQGREYLDDAWNYLDMMNIILGYFNLFLQYTSEDKQSIGCKIVMIVVILIQLLKTFFFLRIKSEYSYIVTMIVNVVSDLRVFLLFFSILIIMFSSIFNIVSANPADIYRNLNPFFANIMTTLRLSLGDFDFGLLESPSDKEQEECLKEKKCKAELSKEQHVMFWAIWIMMVLFSALIFLNFIIAEVSNSYQSAKIKIESLIYKERANLVMEAEDFIGAKQKAENPKKFPAYVVIRQQDT